MKPCRSCGRGVVFLFGRAFPHDDWLSGRAWCHGSLRGPLPARDAAEDQR